jgi:hypothetical protein
VGIARDRRVFLHVGAPKTGTTFLQNVLWQNRAALARAGVSYPLDRPDEHFAATMDLREMAWGQQRDPRWHGAWERLAARARAAPGPSVVISSELLGGAIAEQAARAVASVQPAEVHVVFTARDLARQLPSDWQEHLKHRHQVSFGRFVTDLVELGPDAPAPFGEMFWGLHDPVDVLSRWRGAVPPERIHVVTVPQPGAPAELLWERFASVLGVDPTAYDTQVSGVNTSLGVVECELLRRINIELRGRIAQRHYDPLVRLQLAGILAPESSGPSSTKLALPPELAPPVTERSRQLSEGIRAAGYDVVGDLDELVPAAAQSEPPPLQPEQVGCEALLGSALVAISGLLQAMEEGREELAATRRQLRRWQRRPLREWLISRSERHRPLMRARRGYWWAVNELRRRPGP